MTALSVIEGGASAAAPLYNPDAERGFLGALMWNGTNADDFADKIAPNDFFEPLHGRIFAAIQRQSALGKSYNPVAIRGYFETDPAMAELGGVGYLARLSNDAAQWFSAKPLAEQIVDLSRRRKLREGLLAAAAACGDVERSLPEVISEADSAIQSQAQSQSSAQVTTIGDAIEALEQSLDEPDNGVSSPLIPSLDDLLGRLRAGRMYVFAGRPGMGKTSVALNYARGAAQIGHGVQFFSLEMSAIDLAGKAISEASFSGPEDVHVPHIGIEKRNLTDRQRRGFAETRKFLSSMPLEIVDEGSMTIGRIRSRVRSCKRRMAAKGLSLDLIVVDYLQLVRADRPTRSVIEEVTEVSKGLKALAMDEGVAVMALAQLSRAVEQRQDKRPVMSDLRESGQIEQDADAILFLLREEYYHRQSRPDEDAEGFGAWDTKLHKVAGVIEFILAKKRLGSVGTAFGKFLGAYQAVR